LARHRDDLLAISQKQYVESLAKRAASEKNEAMLAEADRLLVKRGSVIYGEYCSTCHGQDGKGLPTAPSIANNTDVNGDPDKLIKIMLHGLTGPINGKTYPGGLMVPIGHNDDEYIASVLSYVRNDLGNKAPTVHPERVKQVREQTKDRTKPYTKAEL